MTVCGAPPMADGGDCRCAGGANITGDCLDILSVGVVRYFFQVSILAFWISCLAARTSDRYLSPCRLHKRIVLPRALFLFGLDLVGSPAL